MNNNLGKRIKEARKIKKITQAELAKKLNISQQTLRSYETDHNSKINILKELSDSLNVPLDLLVNGVDERFKDEYSFENLVQNHDLYNEYISRLNFENEAEAIKNTQLKIDIFNEMVNFIEEMALYHNDEKFDILYRTVQLLIKEEILKQRQENNKKNIFLDYVKDKLDPKYSINFNGKKLGLSENEKEQLKSILPSLKSIFDI